MNWWPSKEMRALHCAFVGGVVRSLLNSTSRYVHEMWVEVLASEQWCIELKEWKLSLGNHVFIIVLQLWLWIDDAAVFPFVVRSDGHTKE